MGERRSSCWALVEKSEGNIPPAKPRRRWEDNMKMEIQ